MQKAIKYLRPVLFISWL